MPAAVPNHLDEKGALQFTYHGNPPGSVASATVNIYVRTKKTATMRPTAVLTSTAPSRRRSAVTPAAAAASPGAEETRAAGTASGVGRRLKIAVYPLAPASANCTDDQRAVSLAQQYMPAGLHASTSARRTRTSRWMKLLLPVTFVQDVLDSGEPTIRLRVVCENCDNDMEMVTLPPQKKTKKDNIEHS